MKIRDISVFEVTGAWSGPTFPAGDRQAHPLDIYPDTSRGSGGASDTVSEIYLEIGTDEFSFFATGKMNLQGQLDLEARLVILSDFSTSLTGAVEEFTYLRNDQNQIVIPFIPFSGRIDGLKLFPDVGGLGKKFIKNKGRDELRRVIFKALDIKQGLNQAETQEGDALEREQANGLNHESNLNRQKTPERILIENILDSIF